MNMNINEQDVLCGRGGGTNRHNGNIVFRQMVMNNQSSYLIAHKANKKLVAKSIVDEIRRRGGRFLIYDESGNLADVGEIRANEKTCQALREGLKIRANQRQKATRMSEAHNYQDLKNSISHSSITHSSPPVLQYNISTNMHHSHQNEPNYYRYVYPRQNYYQLCHQMGGGRMQEYYREDFSHTLNGCRCAKIGCLKLYCRCFSESILCDPAKCQCKGCFNTDSNIEVIKNARSSVSIKQKFTLQGNDVLNGSTNASQKCDRQYRPRHFQYSPAQGNTPNNFQRSQVKANTRYDFQYLPFTRPHQDFPPVKGSRSSAHTNQLQNSSARSGETTGYRIVCKCQNNKCLQRYCECFNIGAKCCKHCRCVDCKNADG